MLQPKRTKFRKHFRGKMRGAAMTGSSVSFGEIGLKAMEASWITSRQIEAARVAVTRHLKRGGQVWVRVFQALRLASRKLPIPTKTVLRDRLAAAVANGQA